MLKILEAGPSLTVQDDGRPGLSPSGLSRGGALDPLALHEAAALLGRPSEEISALEMPGLGGRFTTTTPLRFALTGAPMRATLEGRPLEWHASHVLEPGQVLGIGPVEAGSVGYLTPAGGFDTPRVMGSRAAHLAGARIGALLAAGDTLPLGDDPAPERPPMRIRPEARFSGGAVRVLPGPQTDLFTEAQRGAFATAGFTRGPRSNRQAMQLASPAEPLWQVAAGGIASEPIQAGDIQITGDGTPFVLLAECQTIGGYPRIGSVHPADMGRVVQAGTGAQLDFRFIDWDEAEAAWQDPVRQAARRAAAVTPLVRDPARIPDLLSYQLISGMTAGHELD